MKDSTPAVIYSDGVAGLFAHGGNLRLTLETMRADHSRNPAPVRRFVVACVILPAGSAERMARLILEFAQKNSADVATEISPDKSSGPSKGSLSPTSDRPLRPSVPERQDDGRSPEIFVDELCGLALTNGNIQLSFQVLRADHTHDPAPVARVLRGIVVMPLSPAVTMSRLVLDFLSGLGNAKLAPSTRTLQ